jgi:hypothetical protein
MAKLYYGERRMSIRFFVLLFLEPIRRGGESERAHGRVPLHFLILDSVL